MALDSLCHVAHTAVANFHIISVEYLVEYVRPGEIYVYRLGIKFTHKILLTRVTSGSERLSSSESLISVIYSVPPVSQRHNTILQAQM